MSVSVRLSVRPDPDGTPPKLTLTGSSATFAVTADATFARPAPIVLTLLTGPPVELLSTPWSAVLTIAERIAAADQAGRWALTTAPRPRGAGSPSTCPGRTPSTDPPRRPTRAADSDFTNPDPQAAEAGLTVAPEGNAHQ
ncbi:MAG TPA: hypothetical protein VNT58_05055, partial [Gaiellaceae bacterium]|nr:hypothetical protein [Gaiellaceae bacterium]